jgi:diguanylate cyclase (GGDEF)-like protein
VNLDINTLLVVTVVDIVALALVSPAVMGLRLGAAANAARWALIVHALAWVSMILSNFWPETLADRLLSTLAIAGFSGTNWLMFHALAGWLGPRRGTRLMAALCVLAPLGYVFMFDSYALRVGWSNTLLAGQMTLTAVACFAPQTPLRGSWRLVVAFCAMTMAALTLGRGMLGAFTDLYPTFLTPHPWNVAAMLMTSLGPLMMNYAILGGWHEEAEVALYNQAITDALTGLLNRRGWQEVARPLVANASRYRLPLALLMIDIDFFKKINDTHGHDAGDRALQALSALLSDCRRANDVTARIGGEEFCLLLPGSNAEAAALLDQRLRQHLPAIAAQLGHAFDFSSGLAVQQEGETLEHLMTRADTALYAAKQGGRGRLQLDEITT